MKHLLKQCGSVLACGVLSAGLICGCDNAKKWPDAPPSLDSKNPKEREAAANEAAREYGAKP